MTLHSELIAGRMQILIKVTGSCQDDEDFWREYLRKCLGRNFIDAHLYPTYTDEMHLKGYIPHMWRLYVDFKPPIDSIQLLHWVLSNRRVVSAVCGCKQCSSML